MSYAEVLLKHKTTEIEPAKPLLRVYAVCLKIYWRRLKTSASKMFCNFLCGELGIRTPGPVTVNSFQDCRNRPLCQLSAAKIRLQGF